MQVNEGFFGKDPKRKKIIDDMKKLGISNYTVNDDYSVNINGSVVITSRYDECPVNINIVNGNFIWHHSALKSMKNLPRIVKGNLVVAHNKITSLVGSQTVEVEGAFNCSDNKLKDLKGSPLKCGAFVAINCGLESLNGCPDEINGDFLVNKNNLTTLVGGPKKVAGTYDCSSNELSSLEGLCPSKKFRADDNPMISNKIEDVEKEQKHEKETIGENVPTVNNKFNNDDYVQYNNKDSKYNGYRGTIYDVDTSSDETLYKINFEYSENPGLVDIVSQANKDKTSVNLLKIKESDLRKVEKEIIERDPNDNFTIGDEALFSGMKRVKIVNYSYNEQGKMSPHHWKVKSTEHPDEEEFIAHHLDLTPIAKKEVKFKVGDRVIYKLETGGELKGKVTWATNTKEQIVDIKVLDIYGRSQSYIGVDLTRLRKDTDPEQEDPKQNFKKGDKIIYIAITGDNRNTEFHLCKGKIDRVNNYADKSYDIFIPHQFKVTTDRTLYNINPENLISDTEDFKKGDRVIFQNEEDELNGENGIITSKDDDGLYQVTFNKNGQIVIITDIKSEQLTKFIKPKGTQVHIDDDVIFTKPDSKYYGYKGTVINYNIGEDKPFEIEVKAKNNRMIQIKTTDDNLELLPPRRKFRKGDKIRYVNPNSPYEGSIGEIEKSTEEKNKYDISITYNKEIRRITTHSDNLILLEEAPDTLDFTFGQKVKYLNPNSKYNGKIGTYDGKRDKDGKIQYSVKFDEGQSYMKIWFDEDESKLEPTDEPLPVHTPTTTYVAPTKKKKEKKKEKEDEVPPILVYNRRPIARREYKAPKNKE